MLVMNIIKENSNKKYIEDYLNHKIIFCYYKLIKKNKRIKKYFIYKIFLIV